LIIKISRSPAAFFVSDIFPYLKEQMERVME